MGSFTNKITAEFTPPKTWKLEEDLGFRESSLTKDQIQLLKDIGANIKDTGAITCTTGMKTDLASTPRIIWALISPWDVARAAIIHDHLYAKLRMYHKTDSMMYSKWKDAKVLSDKIFLMGMKSADPKVPCWKIYPAYWAVRLFGRWSAK
tara:strand:+ start:1282 stop:1731 length:450 start_codon:yes stop_codon:yes gene_type:complete